jgi:hypothetical protein
MESKLSLFVIAFFDHIEQRIDFLSELSLNHPSEAFTLCYCYIEALGNMYVTEQEDKSAYSFVQVLTKFGGKVSFSFVLPKQLESMLSRCTKRWCKTALEKVVPLFSPEYKLYPQDEVLALARPVLNERDFKSFSKFLWKGTLARTSYDNRCEAVHNTWDFPGRSYCGSPVPLLGFDEIYPALKEIFTAMRKLSFQTGVFFGNEHFFD